MTGARIVRHEGYGGGYIEAVCDGVHRWISSYSWGIHKGERSESQASELAEAARSAHDAEHHAPSILDPTQYDLVGLDPSMILVEDLRVEFILTQNPDTGTPAPIFCLTAIGHDNDGAPASAVLAMPPSMVARLSEVLTHSLTELAKDTR